MPKIVIGTHTPETLDNIAKRIAKMSQSLTAVSMSMGVLEFPSLEIKNNDTLIRAMAGLESFDKAARDALEERRVSLGHYGPPPVDRKNKPPKDTKKKK